MKYLWLSLLFLGLATPAMALTGFRVNMDCEGNTGQSDARVTLNGPGLGRTVRCGDTVNMLVDINRVSSVTTRINVSPGNKSCIRTLGNRAGTVACSAGQGYVFVDYRASRNL